MATTTAQQIYTYEIIFGSYQRATKTKIQNGWGAHHRDSAAGSPTSDCSFLVCLAVYWIWDVDKTAGISMVVEGGQAPFFFLLWLPGADNFVLGLVKYTLFGDFTLPAQVCVSLSLGV